MDENKSSEDKFQWIKEIIRANVIAKVKGRQFANIIDMGANSGTLMSQIKNIFPDSRFYAHPLHVDKRPELLTDDIKYLPTHDDVKNHRYDLLLSVFDIHIFNWLQVNEFVKFIHETADDDSTVVVSDISANTFMANLMLKLGALFNPRVKSVISLDQAIELFETRGFNIVDKEVYKINDVWSGWILTCKKTVESPKA